MFVDGIRSRHSSGRESGTQAIPICSRAHHEIGTGVAGRGVKGMFVDGHQIEPQLRTRTRRAGQPSVELGAP